VKITIYILCSNLEFINSLLEKYMPIKFNDIFKKWVNRSNNYNSRFIFIMFIVNIIVLIYILLINLFASAELLFKLNEYVNVYNHNHIHSSKSSFLLFLSLTLFKNKKK